MGRHKWPSSRWISLPSGSTGPQTESISPATMAFSLQTTAGAGSSRQPDAERRQVYRQRRSPHTAERHAAMTWAQRSNVYSISTSKSAVAAVVLSGSSPASKTRTVDRILDHLRQKEQETPARPLLVPPTRAPPGTLSLFAGKDSRPTATPLARKPGIPHGTSGCARSFRIDRIGMAFPTPRTGFRFNDGNFDRSAGQSAQSARMSALDRPLICPMLHQGLDGSQGQWRSLSQSARRWRRKRPDLR